MKQWFIIDIWISNNVIAGSFDHRHSIIIGLQEYDMQQINMDVCIIMKRMKLTNNAKLHECSNSLMYTYSYFMEKSPITCLCSAYN